MAAHVHIQGSMNRLHLLLIWLLIPLAVFGQASSTISRVDLAGIPDSALSADLRDALSQLPPDTTAEKIQEVVYEVGRRPPFLDASGKIKTKDGKPGVSLEWFNMLYQVLLGQEKGPRFGSFVALYGLGNTVDMIDGALARSA